MRPSCAGRVRLLKTGAGLLLAALAGCVAPLAPVAPRPPAFYASLASPGARIDAADAAGLINGYRRNLGLPDVRVDPALMAFAEHEAQALAASGRVDATRAVPLATRLRSAGVAAPMALENVSAGYHTMSDAGSGWRGSPAIPRARRTPGASPTSTARRWRSSRSTRPPRSTLTRCTPNR